MAGERPNTSRKPRARDIIGRAARLRSWRRYTCERIGRADRGRRTKGEIVGYIGPLLLIVAGLLAISNLIIAKKPEAKELIDKVVPYQGFIGVALLAWGIWDLIRLLGWFGSAFSAGLVFALALYAYIASEILLGFLFGIPLIAKWIPGESSGEQKAIELQRKLAVYQTLIGVVGIVSGVLWILFRSGILRPF